LIRPIRLELPIDPIQRARCRSVTEGGSHHLAAPHAAQTQSAHQAFDGTACHLNAFPLQLPPDLVGAIHLKVGQPDALNVRNQTCIPARPGAQQRGIALSGGMAPVSGRGDLQQLADRLDPETLTVLVDEGPHFFLRRSSSA
jgi:hypothetical protein